MRFGVRPGLERIGRLLDALGNPQDAYPIVHVAGTNGKGSTSAMIASILAASGRKVGLYTSPHLVNYGERIVVDGLPISQEELDAVTADAEPAVRRDRELTEFEIGTALAFSHFRRAGVDVAVVEVGLGGRWDATNVVSPALTVITPIDLDHTQVLGDTLEKVAAEKAGILKPGVPLVLAPQQPAAEAVIVERARELGVPVWSPGGGAPPGGEAIVEAFREQPPAVPLVGPHQRVNGSVAVLAGAVLAAMGWGLDTPDVRLGIEGVRWPGRTEVVQRDPVVLLDGAHNPASTRALAAALAEWGWSASSVLVFATLAGKPVVEMLEVLDPFFEDVVFTKAAGRLPGQDPEAMAELVRGRRRGRVAVEPDPNAAFERALAAAGPSGSVLVSGSLYLVGALRGRWPFPRLFSRGAAAEVAAACSDGTTDSAVP